MKGFLGKGIVSIAPWMADKSALAYRDAGNCTSLIPSATTQEVNIPNMRDASGGNDEGLERLQDATLALVLTSLFKENEEIAHRATSTSITTSLGVTDEAHKATPGRRVRTNFLVDTSLTVTVTDGAEEDPETYVAGTDYIVAPTGLIIPEGSSIPANSTVSISYTRVSQYVLEALVNTGGYYAVQLEGYNEYSGEYEGWEWHKVRFGILQNFNLIANEHSPMNLNGRVFRDDTIVTPGASKYYRVWRPNVD
jgi:hypothetical protein